MERKDSCNEEISLGAQGPLARGNARELPQKSAKLLKDEVLGRKVPALPVASQPSADLRPDEINRTDPPMDSAEAEKTVDSLAFRWLSAIYDAKRRGRLESLAFLVRTVGNIPKTFRADVADLLLQVRVTTRGPKLLLSLEDAQQIWSEFHSQFNKMVLAGKERGAEGRCIATLSDKWNAAPETIRQIIKESGPYEKLWGMQVFE